jgi:hypothetical protein
MADFFDRRPKKGLTTIEWNNMKVDSGQKVTQRVKRPVMSAVFGGNVVKNKTMKASKAKAVAKKQNLKEGPYVKDESGFGEFIANANKRLDNQAEKKGPSYRSPLED